MHGVKVTVVGNADVGPLEMAKQMLESDGSSQQRKTLCTRDRLYGPLLL